MGGTQSGLSEAELDRRVQKALEEERRRSNEERKKERQRDRDDAARIEILLQEQARKMNETARRMEADARACLEREKRQITEIERIKTEARMTELRQQHAEEQKRIEVETRQAVLQQQDEERLKLIRDYPRPSHLCGRFERKINIAITGNSGVGKSSLLCKLLGKKPNDHGAPSTGHSGETTMVPTAYFDGSLDNVAVWDCPGSGTPNFPAASYLRDMGLKYFQAVIMVIGERITEHDVKLYKTLQDHNVLFFVVRSKVDMSVAAAEEDHGLTPERAIESIQKSLSISGFNSVYLITTREKCWRGENPFGNVETLFTDVRAAVEKVTKVRQWYDRNDELDVKVTMSSNCDDAISHHSSSSGSGRGSFVEVK